MGSIKTAIDGIAILGKVSIIPIIDINVETLLEGRKQTIEDEAISCIRNEAITTSSPDQFLNTLLKGWDLLSSKGFFKKYGFKLPMHYRSHEVHIVLKQIFTPMWTMKQYFKGESEAIGTGCSVLIAGPLGVGKTTLLLVALVLLTFFTLY